MVSLRPYQQKVVDEVRASYLAGNVAPLVVVPTGGGKTVIFSYITGQTVSRKKRASVLVHRVELLRQTSKALTRFKVKHGLISPKFTPDYQQRAQVASIQTLRSRAHLLAEFPLDLIIVDEAHHATAGTWRQAIEAAREANPKCLVLGVTATPERADGAGLGVEAGGIFDDLIIGPTVAELIAEGYLVKPVIYAPPNNLDLSEIDIVRGDYDKNQVAEAVDKPGITGDAVKHYATICPGVPAVAFCVSVDHAKHVAAEFMASGFQFAAVDGSMPDDERAAILNGLGGNSTPEEKKILQRLGFDRIDGVCSCDLISEGTDIPAVGCVIFLRPTQSLGLYIQQAGRGLRPADGKEFCYILDHVGNVGSFVDGKFVLKHGLPEQDREWSLLGRKKRKGAKKEQVERIEINQCTKCFAVHDPAPACPQCGHVYIVKAKKGPETYEGELLMVTGDDAKPLSKEDAKAAVKAAKTLEELKTIEKQMGYKRGWAKHVYAARNKKTLEI